MRIDPEILNWALGHIRISDRDRVLVSRFCVDGWSYSQIAEVHQLHINTVYQVFHRIKLRVEEAQESYDDTAEAWTDLSRRGQVRQVLTVMRPARTDPGTPCPEVPPRPALVDVDEVVAGNDWRSDAARRRRDEQLASLRKAQERAARKGRKKRTA